MTWYTVTAYYEHTDLSVGLEAEGKSDAEQMALDIMAQEWGANVFAYHRVETREDEMARWERMEK